MLRQGPLTQDHVVEDAASGITISVFGATAQHGQPPLQSAIPAPAYAPTNLPKRWNGYDVDFRSWRAYRELHAYSGIAFGVIFGGVFLISPPQYMRGGLPLWIYPLILAIATLMSTVWLKLIQATYVKLAVPLGLLGVALNAVAFVRLALLR